MLIINQKLDYCYVILLLSFPAITQGGVLVPIKKITFPILKSNLLVRISLFVWFLAILIVFVASLNGYRIEYDFLGFLLTVLGLLTTIIGTFQSASSVKRRFSSVLLITSIVFGCMILISLMWSIQSQVSSTNFASKDSTEIHAYCVPADDLTAAISDMNATIFVEVPDAVRVTIQSTVNEKADDLIELTQDDSNNRIWSAKVRFEIVGTHSIQILAYTEDEKVYQNFLTVKYPF